MRFMLLKRLSALLKVHVRRNTCICKIFVHIVSSFRYDILVVLEESLFLFFDIFVHHCHVL